MSNEKEVRFRTKEIESAERSARFVNAIIRANLSREAMISRDHWRLRRERHGSLLVANCIDARLMPASTLDPGTGIVLEQWNSFAGASPSHRLSAILSKPSLRGCVIASHWDDFLPHADMGYDGCGARTAAHAMENGNEVNMTGASYIAQHVKPHCVESSLEQTLAVSQATDKPCFAMGISHTTQRPHLHGIAQNGRWKRVIDDTEVNGYVPEIEPDEIAQEYPEIAAVIHRGRQVARQQSQEDMQSRRHHSPDLVWVTSSTYPLDRVWGDVQIGKIMRTTYSRYSASDGYAPRDGEGHIISAHTSYPFANAANPIGHGFGSTNALLIDGKNASTVMNIWEEMRVCPETKAWLESGKRLVAGAVINAGQIQAYKKLEDTNEIRH